MRLLVLAGERSARLMNRKMRQLPCRRICSVMKSGLSVMKKARHVRKDDPADFGDQWVFVALDADTKLIPAFLRRQALQREHSSLHA